MSERAQQQQELHFPNWSTLWLWQRKVNDGYTTVPRTMPLAMQVIDAQSKGQPAGHTLFCLWARSPDHPLIIIENPATFAAEAGFSGERAVDTWRRRMKRLVDLCFIVAKKGPAGDFSYVLLQNPNVAVEAMRARGLVQDDLYSRFLTRVTDVGGFGEIIAIRAFWEAQRAAQAAAQAAAPQSNPPTITGVTQSLTGPNAEPHGPSAMPLAATTASDATS
ncbi:hypothetical protein [Cupriavidus pauculus]|uniref:hypothetical protein n=1 Tax=Cupriavidus pauculus TaxID=82633 RepID=UPI0038574ABA